MAATATGQNIDAVHSKLLIALVKNKPVLWDVRHKGYHNRHLVYKEWDDISNQLGINNKTVKCKWKSLRDCFRRELKKGVHSVDGPVPVPTKWPFFEQMTFLYPIMEPKLYYKYFDNDNISEDKDNIAQEYDHHYTLSGVEPDETTAAHLKTENDDNGHQFFMESGESKNFLSVNSHFITDVTLSDNSEDTIISTSGVTGASSERKDINLCNKSDAENTMKRKHSSLNFWKDFPYMENKKLCSTENENFDDNLHFFKSLIPFMRLLPPIRRLKVRNEIHNVLMNELSEDEHNSMEATEPVSKEVYRDFQNKLKVISVKNDCSAYQELDMHNGVNTNGEDFSFCLVEENLSDIAGNSGEVNDEIYSSVKLL